MELPPSFHIDDNSDNKRDTFHSQLKRFQQAVEELKRVAMVDVETVIKNLRRITNR